MHHFYFVFILKNWYLIKKINIWNYIDNARTRSNIKFLLKKFDIFYKYLFEKLVWISTVSIIINRICSIIVICLEIGKHSFPWQITVFHVFIFNISIDKRYSFLRTFSFIKFPFPWETAAVVRKSLGWQAKQLI